MPVQLMPICVLRPLCAFARGPATAVSFTAASSLIHTSLPIQDLRRRAAQRSPDRNDSADAASGGTDFSSLDIFGDTPAPSTSIDICTASGFQLNNGVRVSNGDGILLVGGEAFSWRPWARRRRRLTNAKGQWAVDSSAFALLGLVWPRPDLLILGLGPSILPLCPETRRCITALGMRVEVLDTRNAASQFNLLATERGVDDVAAALIPIGWQDDEQQ